MSEFSYKQHYKSEHEDATIVSDELCMSDLKEVISLEMNDSCTVIDSSNMFEVLKNVD